MAPVTSPAAVIVSHGSPSDPDPQEAFVAQLAAQVAELSGRKVTGATLAKNGALEARVSGLNAPLIYPLFMTDGWFVSTNLHSRLKAAGLPCWRMATPLGMDLCLPELAVRTLRQTMARHNLPRGGTTLVLAAHGSPSDRRPARATHAFGAALYTSGLFREVRTGFVDEAPSLEQAAAISGPALVLPFFAARAGHVLMDLPDALEAAGFDGPVMDPIGVWDGVAPLIANALHAACKADAA